MLKKGKSEVLGAFFTILPFQKKEMSPTVVICPIGISLDDFVFDTYSHAKGILMKNEDTKTSGSECCNIASTGWREKDEISNYQKLSSWWNRKRVFIGKEDDSGKRRKNPSE